MCVCVCDNFRQAKAELPELAKGLKQTIELVRKVLGGELKNKTQYFEANLFYYSSEKVWECVF